MPLILFRRVVFSANSIFPQTNLRTKIKFFKLTSFPPQINGLRIRHILSRKVLLLRLNPRYFFFLLVEPKQNYC